jgi:group I intron endonuclease
MNNKFYIGSAVDLSKRLSQYFNRELLIKSLLLTNSKINRALVKYGYANFNLEILEYTKPKLLLIKEQYYMDLLKPSYNILPTAGSRLGYKSRPETIEKLRILARTPEHIERLRIHNTSVKEKERLRIHNARKEHLEMLLNYSLLKAKKVQVFNTLTNQNNIFRSINEASKFIGCSETAIRKVLKDLKLKKISRLIRKTYLVTPLDETKV